ncbi:MAG: hypothetical protein O3C57_03830 [Verrucomicrobia bacterium]|nr:hypothetical protein [Verrucomicrobiota bacterium]
MNHIVAGAIFPFIIGALIYLTRGCRASLSLLLLTPMAMFACATWAVLPDLPRTFGFSGYDTTVSMNPIIDIFFFHYTINLHEGATDALFNATFAVMLAALFYAAWRELRSIEK